MQSISACVFGSLDVFYVFIRMLATTSVAAAATAAAVEFDQFLLDVFSPRCHHCSGQR